MDMNKLMQQAQQMQSAMKDAQEKLADLSVEAESGGGSIKVKFNGKQELQAITIDPSVVNADEADLLEDLVLTAIQAGQRKASELAEKEMSRAAGPMAGGLGGLF
ncbi:YbaB/EbfC family nucleoid-associated protein [bacterium]|nr:MAG: YbaB/EbfC family nucleoid-associated protein [bacterium]